MRQRVARGLRRLTGAGTIASSLILAALLGPSVQAASPAASRASAPDAAAPPSEPGLPDRLAPLAERLRLAPDRQGRAYAIVDKPTATLFVYRGDGRLAGAAPVLLGRTLGDATVPGTGDRTAAGRLQDEDRTTPAGRFVSEPGRNLEGESVVWLDYDNALAIHRLRPGLAQAARLQRLDSPSAMQRRVSAGCVVVPIEFYETVVEPLLGRSRGWVVVTPEEGGRGRPALEARASSSR